jgi:outer membrane biosynthesis protein TonB
VNHQLLLETCTYRQNSSIDILKNNRKNSNIQLTYGNLAIEVPPVPTPEPTPETIPAPIPQPVPTPIPQPVPTPEPQPVPTPIPQPIPEIK